MHATPYQISEHARRQIKLRNIDPTGIQATLNAPQKKWPTHTTPT
jgi:hypothetical protein